ncbi:FtsX-like permease family protein [Micromonospora terminaliae]|uniref:ABC transporter permease n=1 Tax=Micromonospora terminaliae TaxID=1914461 RepID=A0AAJ2ZHT7_9ACTN|nr:ABC transporter permease [Micromonospora terminaliae]NES30178.1 ABC transporter permease [Micromonospora terminaliae]QGL47048.1 FtsX-like permease family protein [Micromonospora terminaliae]
MWRVTLRTTLARRARLALTLLAVVLGVTFATGSLILTDTSGRLLDDQFRTATAGVDLTVRDAVAFDSAMGVEVTRDPLPAKLPERIAAVPGVASVRPQVRGQGLLEVDGTAVVPSGPSVLASWVPPPLGAFTIRSGRPPAADDEVVIDEDTARAHRIGLGDTVTVRATDTGRLRVVGLAGFGARGGLPNSTIALVTLPSAQRLLRLGSTVSEVAVVAAPGVAPEELRDRISVELGAGYEVTPSRDIAAAGAAAARDQLGWLQLVLLALAAAALLVGAFLIANTFSIVITQRTRELALLRAAGATGGQVLRSVLGEALLVGLAASTAGLGLGVAAATGIRNLAGAFGVPLPEGGLVLTARTVLVAFAVGVVVTVGSAVGPARRAAAVAPVAALRDATAARTGRLRVVAGALAAVAALAATTAVLAAGAPVPLLGVAALGAVGGLALLGPAITPILVRLIGRPLAAAGVTGRLANESAARTPRRTAATALALALGLALISFMAVLGTSVKSSVRQSYAEVITADHVVESARNEMLGGLSPAVYDRVSRLPEVAVASRLRYGHWRDGDATQALTAVDPTTLPRVTSLHFTAGNLAALDGGGIVLAEHVARDRGLAVGDELPMTFSRTGTRSLPVVGLLRDGDARALSTDYLISLDTFARLYSEEMDASVLIRTADGTGRAAAERAIKAALAETPTAQLRDQAAAVAGRTQMIDQVLGLVTVLLMLAVLIALLGITNTLALSITERTAEIGLLRAVGMTRRQLRWMIRGEAVLVAALASVLGILLGVGFAAATVRALGRDAPTVLAVPAGRLLLVLAVALAAGLLAGLLPARRAARLDVLAAIGTP